MKKIYPLDVGEYIDNVPLHPVKNKYQIRLDRITTLRQQVGSHFLFPRYKILGNHS